MHSRILRKEFFITLFLKQNKHHKFGVLVHTLALVKHVIFNGYFKFIPAALLHDIGKPFIAFQDEKDKTTGEYSFHNHEEISYYLIKNWFVSDYTKKIVRYHYLIRALKLTEQRGQLKKYNRLKRIFYKLDQDFKEDLKLFMIFDDKAKESFF